MLGMYTVADMIIIFLNSLKPKTVVKVQKITVTLLVDEEDTLRTFMLLEDSEIRLTFIGSELEVEEQPEFLLVVTDVDEED